MLTWSVGVKYRTYLGLNTYIYIGVKYSYMVYASYILVFNLCIKTYTGLEILDKGE